MAANGEQEETVGRPKKALNRRQFLKVGVGVTAAAAIAGCAPPSPAQTPATPTTAPGKAAVAPTGAPTGVPTGVPKPQATPVAGPVQPLTAQRLIDKPIPEQFFNPFGSNAETRFEHIWQENFVTPGSLFFVRGHQASVLVDPKQWRLSVEGPGVERPFTLTYDELLRLPSTTITRYVECTGNGRSFFQSMMNRPAQGTQWKLGGYGVATWTGVRLSELLDRAGIKPTATEVMAVGLDQPMVRRPITVAKAMEDDTLLAYGMNSGILPIDHGFPARMVVPGWGGVNSIKWVGTIMVTEQHNEVDWNTTSYVLVGPDFPDPPGPARGPAVDEQVMKSAVALPWPATLSAGRQTVRGYAWTPSGTITRVEVSIDGGNTWAPARLIEPNIERAGVRWEFTFDARPGDMTITPRASDATGTQPDISQVRWNELGYGFAAPVPHPVRVT